MGATFTIPLITVIPGQLITASLWNNEWENIDTNFTPAGMDDYSANDSQMQTATDPYPGSVTSRPTSLQGEIERLRYILYLIIGETYWYNHPADTISSIDSRLTALEGNLIAPATTAMIFYQAAAPTGWTKLTSQNDKALRVVSGAGGVSGGSFAISTGHSHTVNSHTHDLGNHTHTLGNHTHSTPAHTHTLDEVNAGESSSGASSTDIVNDSGRLRFSNAGTARNSVKNTTTSGGSGTSGTPSTNTSGTPSSNTSGATAPGTDTQIMAYIDVIVCTKD